RLGKAVNRESDKCAEKTLSTAVARTRSRFALSPEADDFTKIISTNLRTQPKLHIPSFCGAPNCCSFDRHAQAAGRLVHPIRTGFNWASTGCLADLCCRSA